MGAKGDTGLRIRRLAGVLAALLVVLGASGCAKKSTSRAIVFWQFSPLDAIQPVIDRFEADNPGVDVQVEQLTW